MASFSVTPLHVTAMYKILYSVSDFVCTVCFLVGAILCNSRATNFPALVVIVLFLNNVRLFSLKVVKRCIKHVFGRAGNHPACVTSSCGRRGLKCSHWKERNNRAHPALLSVDFVSDLILFCRVLHALRYKRAMFFRRMRYAILPYCGLRNVSLLLVFRFLPIV